LARGGEVLCRNASARDKIHPYRQPPKEESAEAFLQGLETVDPTTWVIYSDGSLCSEGAASYGFAIHQNDRSIYDGSGRLGPAEVLTLKLQDHWRVSRPL
jgi:hypothetical protein